jgi:hypothetical protein
MVFRNGNPKLLKVGRKVWEDEPFANCCTFFPVQGGVGEEFMVLRTWAWLAQVNWIRCTFDLICFICSKQLQIPSPDWQTHASWQRISERETFKTVPTRLDENCDSSPRNILHYYPGCDQWRAPLSLCCCNMDKKTCRIHFSETTQNSIRVLKTDENRIPYLHGTRIQLLPYLQGSFVSWVSKWYLFCVTHHLFIGPNQ